MKKKLVNPQIMCYNYIKLIKERGLYKNEQS